jgi:signal peptidase
MPPQAAAYTDTQRLSIPAASRGVARRRGRVTRIVASIMLGGVVLLILTVVLGMALGLWRFTVIDTGSMRPTLSPGDVAVLTSEPTAELQTGQIVAFHPPGEPNLTVTHRAVSVKQTEDGAIIHTKGDANNARDPWRARVAGPTVWHEDFKLPKLGYLAVWCQQRLTRFAILSVIVALVVMMQLGWIWRPRSQ